MLQIMTSLGLLESKGCVGGGRHIMTPLFFVGVALAANRCWTGGIKTSPQQLDSEYFPLRIQTPPGSNRIEGSKTHPQVIGL